MARLLSRRKRANLSWIHVATGLLFCCLKQCLVLSQHMRDAPGCLFPNFLQYSEHGNWTWKYDGDTHVGHVHGGVYTICSSQYARDTRRAEEPCKESHMRRKCVQEYGPDLFAVKHEEHRPTYQCIKFIQRSQSVVQLAVSDRQRHVEGICSQNMTLDHAPWISLKHYKTAHANCPFTGGYNFRDVWDYTRDHVGKQLCHHSASADKQAPVRVESDCVEKEGFSLHFREKNCIPNDSHFGKSQKLVCMATWMVDGDGFALLRKEHARSFYCVRVVFNSLEVTNIVIYLDWECYRGTDLSGAGGKLSYSTSYVIFQRAEKRIISLPCSDELSTCSASNDADCLEKQCMQTCQQCLNSTGYPCQFDADVIGSWEIRKAHNTRTTLQILDSGLHHSSLGVLKCVTFNPELRIALRSIVWGTYENGCYPRFLCINYDLPAESVLRYRLSNVQQWPLDLSDQSICSKDNFLMSPDFSNPKSTYEEKPWNYALRSETNIRRTPCVYPVDLPDSSSFLDNHNRSGCITFRSKSSPKTISLLYVNRSLNQRTHEYFYLHDQQDYQYYQCIAAMTYLTGFKTVMTLTQGDEEEALCWMIMNAHTVIVVNTSSCNLQTATGILHNDGKFLPHLKFLLNLRAAGKEVDGACRQISENIEKQWLERLKAVIDKEYDTENKNYGSSLYCYAHITICITFVFCFL